MLSPLVQYWKIEINYEYNLRLGLRDPSIGFQHLMGIILTKNEKSWETSYVNKRHYKTPPWKDQPVLPFLSEAAAGKNITSH